MVHDASTVLPTAAAFGPDEDAASSLEHEVESLSRARSSRPYHDDGWADNDHYFEYDEPVHVYAAGEWNRLHKDLGEMQVNGAITRQWKRGREEITQILSWCRDVLGNENLQREYFVEYFYGANLPLFGVCCRCLD